jgi:hypothetical protein
MASQQVFDFVTDGRFVVDDDGRVDHAVSLLSKGIRMVASVPSPGRLAMVRP